ncbi:PREDICTED: uncharacterized protein LOC108772589 [Cyphomyrmex costatus]|uniref:uncharacterized protein LOC108772589 n=1 Tax=Cyphomyrmex costatus TaxID=456900 RepID=UPI0008522260|nr:PREDICTED: uncharacterized protein LOC108772589 [Cyphomyrmex costatus]
MDDFSELRHSSGDFAKTTKFNLPDKDSLIKTVQINKSTLSRNEDVRSCVNDGENPSFFKTSVSKPTQKKVISISSILRLSTPRSYKSSSDSPDLTKVKISALLYEITERMKQLAQPRSRITKAELPEKVLKSKAPSMSRIIELACPKVIHDSAPKPINSVSPSALKAIATQRIIELSQPRKDRCFMLSRRKTQIHRLCNLRIRGLSKLKQMDHSDIKAKLLNSPEENKLDMTKLLHESLRLTFNADRDARQKRKKFKRKDKPISVPEEMRKRQSSLYLSNTNSDRSVVVVGTADWEKRPRFNIVHKSRKSRYCKSSKITKEAR